MGKKTYSFSPLYPVAFRTCKKCHLYKKTGFVLVRDCWRALCHSCLRKLNEDD